MPIRKSDLFKDISFQSAHAVYTLERTLHEISRRSETFDIVFWHGMFLQIFVNNAYSLEA